MLQTECDDIPPETISIVKQKGIAMSKVKVSAFSLSLDGYGAGVDQSLENPLGKRGEELHEWIFPTRMFQKMYGKEDGVEGIDNDFAEK